MDLSLIIHYILDREDVNEAVGVTDVLWCVYMESLYLCHYFCFHSRFLSYFPTLSSSFIYLQSVRKEPLDNITLWIRINV